MTPQMKIKIVNRADVVLVAESKYRSSTLQLPALLVFPDRGSKLPIDRFPQK
jgi:hypothetical protein